MTSAKIVDGTIQGIDIRDQTIAPRDIRIGAVTNARLGADAVTTDKVADGTITGADVQADSLGSSDIQNLQGVDLQPESLTGTQIVESTLGQVRSAALGGIGRSAARHPACDPESETFVDCGYTTLTLPSSSRVLILGRLEVSAEIGADLGQGVCRLVTNVGVVAGSSANVHAYEFDGNVINLMAVSGVLAAGTYDFGIECHQYSFSGNAVVYYDGQVAAVALSPN